MEDFCKDSLEGVCDVKFEILEDSSFMSNERAGENGDIFASSCLGVISGIYSSGRFLLSSPEFDFSSLVDISESYSCLAAISMYVGLRVLRKFGICSD